MAGSSSASERARAFLATAETYALGQLPTEQPHPDTAELGDWAMSDLGEGIRRLRAVDIAAVERLVQGAVPAIEDLRRAIRRTLDRGDRVFLCGCGATGRLALSLETLWREVCQSDPATGPALGERVIGFMAGGDGALVRAAESVEDLPDIGGRHLQSLGFTAQDLLISCTEGGETPYVIGATERAADLGARPYFLYCNPSAELSRAVERSRRVLADPRIACVELFVGPMALSGSTRMQATTALMLAVGAALFSAGDRDVAGDLGRFLAYCRGADLAFLAEFITREADLYRAGGHIAYATDRFGITVLTDTTERGPTFSLTPFENLAAPGDPRAWACLVLPGADSAAGAWRALLGREPRQVADPEVAARAHDPATLLGFDFSASGLDSRRARYGPGPEARLWIGRGGADPCVWQFHGDGDGRAAALVRHAMPLPELPLVYRHIALKLALNIHSTLVMGRMGRYQKNIMTWVRPSNGKLIDRAARYIGWLLEAAGAGGRPYEEIVEALFHTMARAAPDQSVVLETVERLSLPGETLR